MFPGERVPLPAGGGGLLRGNSTTRSYGSLVQSSHSPVRQRRVEHQVQPGETLQGIALKYGVSMEKIKRANRLYTHDSIFLKKSLSIPVLSDYCPAASNGLDRAEGHHGQGLDITKDSTQNEITENRSETTQAKETSELSPMDFLKMMDGMISLSKEAAVKRYQEGEERLASLEAAFVSRTSDRRLMRSHSATITSSPRMHQHATLGAVPLTITKCTRKLKEQEDEIFEL
ncbi:hypothetical protein DPEC_G00353140 [Dallia pectoralis]|uniref:Uncharacterized protein n=1 Tax=Dallia pectoralis TaxID=75939 RepID=A0ACC2F2F8_DALPE|nr:hypothetical protein DPEC_G00353140 [Dallia pectoralis]